MMCIHSLAFALAEVKYFFGVIPAYTIAELSGIDLIVTIHRHDRLNIGNRSREIIMAFWYLGLVSAPDVDHWLE